MLRSNSKSLGNPCSQSQRRKGKAAVGRICRKGMKERVGDGKLIILSMTDSSLVTIMSFCIISCVLLCVFYFSPCCIRAY